MLFIIPAAFKIFLTYPGVGTGYKNSLWSVLQKHVREDVSRRREEVLGMIPWLLGTKS